MAKPKDVPETGEAVEDFVGRIDSAYVRLADAQFEVKEARRALKELQEHRLRSMFG